MADATLVKEEVKTELKYKQLPPPIVAHLELTFGDWLNHFDIGQEYKQDFGGYGIYIVVPERFSTAWVREKRVKYDNRTRKEMVDEKGNTVMQDIVHPDTRWKNLKDIDDVKKWINLVKENIINTAYQKGIQLPSTMAKLDETKQTRDEYVKSLHK